MSWWDRVRERHFRFYQNFNLFVLCILNIFNLQTPVVMKNLLDLQSHQLKLQSRYKQLIEQAYNVRQTDHALSDISEFKAIKLLNKLNRLKYLSRDINRKVIS